MNPEAVEKMKKALRGGNDVETSAHFAGISISNVYRWLEIGKIESELRAMGQPSNPESDEYVTFWEDLRSARAEAIVRNVSYIQNAAQSGSWQASAWWLERTVPETYARTKSSKPEVEPTAQKTIGA